MIPVSLNKAKFSWEGHKSVLCWLGLLYRRPEAFRKDVENLSLRESIFVYFKIWLHSLPYISLLIITVSVILISAILWLGSNDSLTSTSDILFSHINQVAKGIVFGIVDGFFGGITERIPNAILSGILLGILKGVTEAEEITKGIKGIALGSPFWNRLRNCL